MRGERIGGRVRQITVLNLGRNFAIKQDDWPILCLRLEQLLQPQEVLLGTDCAAHIEVCIQPPNKDEPRYGTWRRGGPRGAVSLKAQALAADLAGWSCQSRR